VPASTAVFAVSPFGTVRTDRLQHHLIRPPAGSLLARLHDLDAGSAVENAIAIENSQVHQLIAKNVGDDSGERLSAVNVRKAIVAGKAGRRKPHNAA
jgi:hypothetical protein